MRQYTHKLLSGLLLSIAAGLPFCEALPAAEQSPLEPNEALTRVLRKKYPRSTDDLRVIQSRVQQVAKRLLPCTVAIRIGKVQGSGILVSRDGYVLTAGHVVGQPGRDVHLVMSDGRTVKGKTLGLNRSLDSGLIKISDLGPWPCLPMAQHESTSPGEWCLSAGYFGGSRKNRPATVRLGRVLFTSDSLLCTDCTLIGGDSGGPLVNLDGEVIGIHSRIGWQVTTNFHVPIRTFQETWDRLAAGEVWGVARRGQSRAGPAMVRPWIGVSGIPDKIPCAINQVSPKSPAERAGIRPGDIIRRFDGSQVTRFRELAWLLHGKKPGEEVAMELKRAEQLLQVKIILGRVLGPLPGGAPPASSSSAGYFRFLRAFSTGSLARGNWTARPVSAAL